MQSPIVRISERRVNEIMDLARVNVQSVHPTMIFSLVPEQAAKLISDEFEALMRDELDRHGIDTNAEIQRYDDPVTRAWTFFNKS